MYVLSRYYPTEEKYEIESREKKTGKKKKVVFFPGYPCAS
jgi:hypothetical protein